MITFSIAMMVMVPNVIHAWKGADVNVEIPGALFLMTGILDVIIVAFLFGPL